MVSGVSRDAAAGRDGSAEDREPHGVEAGWKQAAVKETQALRDLVHEVTKLRLPGTW